MKSKLLIATLASTAIGGIATADAAPLQLLRNNTLVTVDSASPATAASTTAISGITAGQTLTGIDYRPASPRVLYSVSNAGQIYAINGVTGAATAVGSPIAAAATAAGTGVGLDFNPTVDRVRFVTTTGTDLRLNQLTGAVAATDGNLAYAGVDANAGQTPVVAGSAYTNNVATATTTTLYNIDTRGGTATARLVTQGNANVSPNTGILFTVGSTGVTTTNAVGFDIAQNGTAYATMTSPTTGITSLYTVNLATGAATLVGAVTGNATYTGLAVQLASFQSMGRTANQAAVGTLLDRFTGTPNADTLALFNNIDSFTGNGNAQSAILQSLTPAAFAEATTMSMNAIESQENTLLRYTRDLRGQATMADGTTATLDEAGRVGAWITGGSRMGIAHQAVDRFRTQFDEYHVLGGADFRLTPTAAIGGFGGYSRTNASFAVNGAADGDLSTTFGGLYGTAAVGPAYIDAWGSYNDLDWTFHRNLTFGNTGGSTVGRADGRVWAAGAATGLSFSVSNFEIEPFAQIRYADIKIDGFSETGGTVFALNVGDMKDKQLRANLGARVGTKIEIGGATIRPQARGGWFHDFWAGRRPINASFQTASFNSPFGFQPTRFSSDYWNAGGALSIAGNGPLSMVADFDYQGDRERRFYNFSIGARLAL